MVKSDFKLPKKLTKEPLIDAIFELRFLDAASASLSTILPGVFLQQFSDLRLTPLPAQSLPPMIRATDPNLKYAALVRLENEKFIYLIGDHTLAICSKIPYVGWDKFKSEISAKLKLLKGISLLSKLKLERYAMKYTNLVEASNLLEQASQLDWTLEISDFKLKKEDFQVRIVKKEEGFTSIISFLSSATALPNNVEKKGVIVDVDTLKNTPNLTLQKLKNLNSELDEIHESTKRNFFMCLKEKTIENLGPVYG